MFRSLDDVSRHFHSFLGRRSLPSRTSEAPSERSIQLEILSICSIFVKYLIRLRPILGKIPVSSFSILSGASYLIILCTWVQPRNLEQELGETLVTREEVCRLWLLLSRRSHSGLNLLRWLTGTALCPDSLCRPQRCRTKLPTRYGTTCFQAKVSPWTETGVLPKGP